MGLGGGDGLSEALLLGEAPRRVVVGRATPALAHVLTTPSRALVAFPSLPFHFLQLMSRTSTPADVTWTPWAKAPWAGPAVPFPSRPSLSPGQSPPRADAERALADPTQMLSRRGLSRCLSPKWLCRRAEQVCPGAGPAQQCVSDVTRGAGKWCGEWGWGGPVCARVGACTLLSPLSSPADCGHAQCAGPQRRCELCL